MFVDTPRMRNSATARRARRTAVGKSRPRHVSFTSIESKWALTSAPTCVPPSSRMPAPPGLRYAVMRPVSGRNPFAGSSVVIRHCSAAPCGTTESWLSPRDSRVSPLAMRSCDDTRSTSVISSVTVCSTWMRGFISMNTCSTALVEQELHRARAAVTDLAGERHRVGADPLPQRRIEVRRRRQLDDLLVAPLHAAVALEQVDHVALRVGQDLHLDVAGIDHRLLEEHRRIPERRLRFATGRFDRLRQSGRVAHPAHATAAAAGHGLDEQAGRSSRPRRPRVRPPTTTAPRTPAPATPRRGPPRSHVPCCPSAPAPRRTVPTNVMPAAAHAAARSGFSDRNPYPG